MTHNIPFVTPDQWHDVISNDETIPLLAVSYANVAPGDPEYDISTVTGRPKEAQFLKRGLKWLSEHGRTASDYLGTTPGTHIWVESRSYRRGQEMFTVNEVYKMADHTVAILNDADSLLLEHLIDEHAAYSVRHNGAQLARRT
jgi:hypothetical protein